MGTLIFSVQTNEYLNFLGLADLKRVSIVAPH